MTKLLQEQDKRTDLLSFGAALLVPFISAAIGSAATDRTVDTWYRGLRKPSWNPPGAAFPVVWTLLYAMMGIASWLIWREGRNGQANGVKTSEDTIGALKLYGVQLVFNALWSVLFFGMKRIDLALGEITLLWSLIAATATHFYQIKPLAGLLLLPYLLWTSFATALNFTLWRMNR